MKFTLTILTTLLAASFAGANAAPEATAGPEALAFRRFCHMPGQRCSKLKRAADAAAEALAEAEPEPDAKAEPFRRFCHMPGQRCSKAKRSADALAEAVAKANAAASPEPEAEAGKSTLLLNPTLRGMESD